MTALPEEKIPETALPARSPAWRRGLVALVLGLASTTAGWWMGRTPPSLPSSTSAAPSPSPGAREDVPVADGAVRPVAAVRNEPAYVGSTVCTECHAEIARRYAQHPMANSACGPEGPPLPGESSGTFDVLDMQYAAARTDAGSKHQVRRAAPDGERLYDVEEEIACVIGSGRRGRSYLVLKGAQLYQSPLTWYATNARWDLSPGFADSIHGRGFERLIGDSCVNCHVGRVHHSESAENLFERPLLIEAGIGCERCHGPGGEHVVVHRERGGKTPATGSDVIDPAALTGRLRDSLCYQCHLVGAHRIPTTGRSEYDFRPGEPLETQWITFVEGVTVTDGRTSAVSHVEQYESSQCFRMSSGRMTCTSCHDPHGVPDAADRARHFRDRCLACHGPEASCAVPEPDRRRTQADDSCIECHMPRLGASDVPHTSQTDHRILRRAIVSGAGATPPVAGSPELLPFRPPEDDASRHEVARARALLMGSTARSFRDRILGYRAAVELQRFSQEGPDELPVERERGAVLSLLNRTQEARIVLERARERWPADIEVRRLLAQLDHESGDYRGVVEVLEPILGEISGDRDTMGRLIHSLGKVGRAEEGRTLADELVRSFPYDSQVQQWRRNYYQQAGELQKAGQIGTFLKKLDAGRGR